MEFLYSWAAILRQIFGQTNSKRVKILSNTNLVATRHITQEKGSLLADKHHSKMRLPELHNNKFPPKTNLKVVRFETWIVWSSSGFGCSLKSLIFSNPKNSTEATGLLPPFPPKKIHWKKYSQAFLLCFNIWLFNFLFLLFRNITWSHVGIWIILTIPFIWQFVRISTIR